MNVSDFDYHLPEHLIAQTAVARGASRLLHLDGTGSCHHRFIRDLPSLLDRGDLMVVNNTRVLPARLFARRQTGGRVELLLVERRRPQQWDCLVRPGRRMRPGTILKLAPDLEAEVLERLENGMARIGFSAPIRPRLDTLGHTPLPPYIKRAPAAASPSDAPAATDTHSATDAPSARDATEAVDRERYQTIFAHRPGAIAAPTAGLHFDQALVAALAERGVETAEVTLHVGIGTFKPIDVETIGQHRMEGERFELGPDCADAINRVRSASGRIIAVGTTVVRTLESVARSPKSATTPAAGTPPAQISSASGVTDLFITPGHRFEIVDRLVTNFHLPKSTLLLLVAAFAGRSRVLAAYQEAVERSYRFYSYGDAMLIDRPLDPDSP